MEDSSRTVSTQQVLADARELMYAVFESGDEFAAFAATLIEMIVIGAAQEGENAASLVGLLITQKLIPLVEPAVAAEFPGE